MIIFKKSLNFSLSLLKVLMETTHKRGFQKWLAHALGITESLLSMIINDKRTVSTDIARRLHRKFPETTVSYWLDMPILKLEVCLWDLCKPEYLKSLSEPKEENFENRDT